MPTHAISIRVDKKTFQKWARSMATLRTQWQVPVTGIDDVTKLPTLPARYRFSGLKLLREVGLAAASRSDVLNDPARHFAILKYATAIADGDRFLLVSDLARSDSHKKKVLSDEMGAGFAFLVARELLGARRFLDLRMALDDGLVQLAVPRAEQPDYVAHTSTPGQLIVVEAKGTQSNPGYSRTQVRRGCEQVANVAVVDPSTQVTHRVAIAIALARMGGRYGSALHISDPAPSKHDTLRFEGDPRQLVARAHFAAVAALIGDEAANYRARRRPGVPAAPPGEFDVEPIAGCTFVGSRLSITSENAELNLFAGLDQEVRSLLLSDEVEEADARADKVFHKVQSALRGSIKAFGLWQDVSAYGEARVFGPGQRIGRVGLLNKDIDGPDEKRLPLLESGLDTPQQPAMVVDDDGTLFQISMKGSLALDEAEKEAEELASRRA